MSVFQSKLLLLTLIFLVQWVSCKVVQFELNLTWEDEEVAGFTRKAIATNGQIPGPPLWIQQGEDVEILVNNSMPFGTTIHFHGIEQRGTPWSDGVPGLSQYEIAPGDQFLYRWKAEQYGIYMYHAHTRGQTDDGCYGAMYIQPDESEQRPFELIAEDEDDLDAMLEAERNTQPVLLSDWRHLTAEEIWQAEIDSGVPSTCSVAVLINGKGSVKCLSRDELNANTTPTQRLGLGDRQLTDLGCMPAVTGNSSGFPQNADILPETFQDGCRSSQGPEELFIVNPDTRYSSFDVLSMTGSSQLVFSIDEHPMYIYAVDGRYVEPVEVDAITLPIGTRYSVLVKLDKTPGDYTIRAANSFRAQLISGTGVLSYHNADKQRGPSTPSITLGGATTDGAVLLNESTIVPFPAVAPALQADHTYILNVGQFNASYRWVMGNSSFPLEAEEATPLLLNRTSIPTEYTITTHNNTWVDLIINVTTAGQPAHPIHKHSTKFFVIGEGSQPWTWSSVDEAIQDVPQNFNLKDPQLRDTYATPAAGTSPTWLALRYHVVNPGPFLLHCHIQMHMNGGMALAVLDGDDAWPEVPEGYLLPAVE